MCCRTTTQPCNNNESWCTVALCTHWVRYSMLMLVNLFQATNNPPPNMMLAEGLSWHKYASQQRIGLPLAHPFLTCGRIPSKIGSARTFAGGQHGGAISGGCGDGSGGRQHWSGAGGSRGQPCSGCRDAGWGGSGGGCSYCGCRCSCRRCRCHLQVGEEEVVRLATEVVGRVVVVHRRGASTTSICRPSHQPKHVQFPALHDGDLTLLLWKGKTRIYNMFKGQSLLSIFLSQLKFFCPKSSAVTTWFIVTKF